MDIASTNGGGCKVAVPKLGRIANFDDLDPLSSEPEVTVDIIEPGRALPGDADLVLIPGSKATIADLKAFRANGWDIDLAAHIRRGGEVLGICGGYQMLGTRIDDPDGLEGAPASVPGLGHLNVVTVMKPEKRLALTQARCLDTGDAVEGYEIHLGTTTGADCARAWLRVDDRAEGAASSDGRVRGTYLHGLFASDRFRGSFLGRLGARSRLTYGADVEATLDALAQHLEDAMRLDLLLQMTAEVAP